MKKVQLVDLEEMDKELTNNLSLMQGIMEQALTEVRKKFDDLILQTLKEKGIEITDPLLTYAVGTNGRWDELRYDGKAIIEFSPYTMEKNDGIESFQMKAVRYYRIIN